MSTQWTQQQRTAIEHRGNALLVSAAAGSGKTATLVERVLRFVLDPEQPHDIDEFLIVTFTKAAASEMRGKIADALTKASAQNPQNARLRRQLVLVHRAKITTVHAFCMGLLREHFHELGLTADFRTADEDEQKLMKRDTLEETLEQLYDSDDDGFQTLADSLSAGRDDRRLMDTVLETFETLQASPNPKQTLARYREAFTQPFDRVADTVWGKELLADACDRTEYGMQALARALEDMESAPDVREKYEPAFLDDLRQAQDLHALLLDGAWDGAVAQCHALCASRMRLAAVRGYPDKEYLDRLKAVRTQWKKLTDDMEKKVLCATEQQVRDDLERMTPAVCALCGAVQMFADAYAQEKRRRGVVDFNDLEHFALELLVDEQGQPTPLAKELHFAEIMVDEYQDTNAVQDAIFRAISEDERNLFLVGDVKQSIYRFRLANPAIFLERYRKYRDANMLFDDAPARIVLSKNFRSRPQVLDAVNHVFSAVMSERLGDLTYTAREALYPGAQFPQGTEDYRTEFCLLETHAEEEDAPERVELEADYCAGRIEHMLRTGFRVTDKTTQQLRPCRPEDFVILLRSAKTKAPIYRQALLNRNISAVSDAQTDLLTAPEVRTLVSYLEVVDNPRQDVPLLAVLRSPLVGFTEQELAEIRMRDLQHDFYTALKLDVERDKTQRFLTELEYLRTLAPDLPVQQLLWHLIDRTRAMALYGAMPGGQQRQQAIAELLELAGTFERSGSRGLFAFVRRLREQMEQGGGMTIPEQEDGGNAVRILTIHKSKGLEFPIVLVAECAAPFNEMDLRKNVLIHEKMGISMRCRDAERGIQYDGIDRLAMSCALRRETVSEEMRVLYVALTRAREKLIVTCSVPNMTRTAEQWAAIAQLAPIPPYALSSVRCPALWLGVPLLRHPAAQQLRALCAQPPELEVQAPDCFAVHALPYHTLAPQACAEPSDERTASAPLCAPELKPYRAAVLADLPSKLTATGIADGFRAKETMEQTAQPVEHTELRRPRFQKTDVPLSPAEIGTAHHLFLQFCVFDRCRTEQGRQQELNRLRDAHILSAMQADAVDLRKIGAFFQSELFAELDKASFVRKEFKFSVLVSAAEYFPEAHDLPDEQVLLQGVIDCLYENAAGELVVVDFKTDRIRPDGAPMRAMRYADQLKAYRRAAQEVFERPAKHAALFFLHTGQCVWA